MAKRIGHNIVRKNDIRHDYAEHRGRNYIMKSLPILKRQYFAPRYRYAMA